MGLIVRCCPSLGNQGLQFLLLFRGQFDTVLLSRHDPSPWIQFANAGRIHKLYLHSMTFNYWGRLAAGWGVFYPC